MSRVAVSGEPAVQAGRGHETVTVGVATRAVSWVIDAVLVNVVAVLAGLGIFLFLHMIPLSKHLATALKPIAGGAYLVWVAAYFVGFWSTTGQTPGARILQIRLVRPKGTKVRVLRSIVRWVGMNLAMLPLFAGYLPVLWGRRPFPDWLARTVVVEAPQLSLAEVAQARKALSREASRASGPRSTSLSG